MCRRFFINLPPVEEMYSTVPSKADVTHESDKSASTSTEDTLSLDSLLNMVNTDIEPKETSSPSRGSRCSSTGGSVDDDFVVDTPCCDFIINYLFSQCYADLLTIYTVRCQETDKKYFERVVYLNAYTDARLLKYLEVSRELWPTDSETTKDLDTFAVRITARRKYYESAINTLQRLSSEFNPGKKLAILVETFSEISACVSQFSSVGRKHVWTSDDLLPAFMYVVVRAQLQHLGAEIRLISDFCPQLSGAGQIELMFTMLRASYVQICTEKSIP
jgi:hypothetical protein